VRFWDSSALVPSLVAEPTSETVRALIAEDSSITAWWATDIECTSALARRERTGALEPGAAADAYAALTALGRTWTEVSPSERIRDNARRLVRVHDLSASDALQLSAAREASDEQTESLPFVTLDERLALAARREGFPVLPLGAAVPLASDKAS